MGEVGIFDPKSGGEMGVGLGFGKLFFFRVFFLNVGEKRKFANGGVDNPFWQAFSDESCGIKKMPSEKESAPKREKWLWVKKMPSVNGNNFSFYQTFFGTWVFLIQSQVGGRGELVWVLVFERVFFWCFLNVGKGGVDMGFGF